MPETTQIVPLERLEALERQFFPMLPDNPPGRDLKAVVLEAIAARKSAADNPDARHFVLPRLNRAPDDWAKIAPAAIAGGDRKRATAVLREAQQDIATLVASLSEAVRRLANG